MLTKKATTSHAVQCITTFSCKKTLHLNIITNLVFDSLSVHRIGRKQVDSGDYMCSKLLHLDPNNALILIKSHLHNLLSTK